VVLISTRDEDDFAEMIAASPAIGFIPRNRLSARAIWNVRGASYRASPTDRVARNR
jgi:hypothetical protein